MVKTAIPAPVIYTMTKREFYHGVRSLIEKRAWRNMFIGLSGIAFGAFTMLYFYPIEQTYSVIIITVSAFLLVMGAYMYFLMPRIMFKRFTQFNGEITLTCSEGYLQCDTKMIHSQTKWNAYKGIRENNDIFFLSYNHGVAQQLMIPKRAFKDAKQIAAFRTFVQKCIPPARIS